MTTRPNSGRAGNDDRLGDAVGRRLLIGFEDARFTPELETLLRETRPAGIILFGRNVGRGPEAVAELVEFCQNLARSEFGRSLLVAIDQEGGPVRRLGPPFFQAPSQREMAETMTPAQVRDLARKSGRELAAVGINLNLAPVLDLATDPEARFMYERCFSHDPETALAYGLAVIEGHRDHGILTAAKHFPGIGATRRDPHLELPTVDLSEDRIRRVDMVPFAGAVSARVDAVMTSHIVYPALDPTQAATFSPKIVTSLLREELGFEGLILTDDMEMGAVTGQGNIGPAAVRSVLAGADLVLVCRRAELVREVRACLYQAAETDALSLADMQKGHDRLALALDRVAAHPREALKEVFQVA